MDIATSLPGCIGVAKQEGGVCPNGNGDFRVVGNSFFFARNADGINCDCTINYGDHRAYFEFARVDISRFENVTVSLDYSANQTTFDNRAPIPGEPYYPCEGAPNGTHDQMVFIYILDGDTTVADVVQGTTAADFTNIWNANIPNGTFLTVRVNVANAAGTEEFYFRNLKIRGKVKEPNAGPEIKRCDDPNPFQLQGSGIGTWVTTGTGTISNPNDPNATYTPDFGPQGDLGSTIPFNFVRAPFSQCLSIIDSARSQTLVHFIGTKPTLSINNIDPICQGDSVIISGKGADTLVWTTSSGNFQIVNDSVIKASPPVSTTYTLKGINKRGCSSTSSIDVIVNPNPNVSIAPIAEACPGDTVLLSTLSDPSYNYTWFQENVQISENENEIKVQAPGNFSVTVTDSNNCRSSDTVDVLSSPVPSLIVSLQDSIYCLNGRVVLFASGFVDYQWSTGQSGPNAFFDIQSDTIIHLEAFYGNGCKLDTSFFIPKPIVQEINLPADLSFCQGTSLKVFTDFPFKEYLWSTIEKTDTILINRPGNYSLVAKDENDCDYKKSFVVTEKMAPLPKMMGNPIICDTLGTKLTLDQTYNSYLWSDGSTDDSLSIKFPGEYQVTVTNAEGCKGTDTLEVFDYSLDPPIISGVGEFCPGDSVVLAPNAGYISYLWSNGDTTQQTTILQSGTVSLQVSNEFGCKSSATKEIIQRSVPVPSIQGSPQFCEGDSTAISVIGNFSTYEWGDGKLGRDRIVRDTGILTAVLTTAEGCRTSLIEYFSHKSTTKPEIIGANQICKDSLSDLMVVQAFPQYVWSTGDTTAQISIQNTGLYFVEIRDTNGCFALDSFLINQFTEPAITFSGSQVFCEDDSTRITVKGNFTDILWADGSTDTSRFFYTAQPLGFLVKDVNGCGYRKSINLNQLPGPAAAILGARSICTGSETTLEVDLKGLEYEWSTGQVTDTIRVIEAGQFMVTVTDVFGCKTNLSAEVVVSAALQPNITGNASICEGVTNILDAGSFFDYEWSTGSLTRTIVADTGTFVVKVSDGKGCTGLDTFMVTRKPALNLPLESAYQICNGDVLELDLGLKGTYQWSNGDTSRIFRVQNPNTYTLNFTDVEGCVGNATFELSNFSPYEDFIIGATEFCRGLGTTISVSGLSNAQWNTGSQTDSLFINMEGVYSVEGLDSNNCPAQDTIFIKEETSLRPIIEGHQFLCGPLDTTSITSLDDYFQYIWSNGDTLKTAKMTEPGSYTLIVSDKMGCKGQIAFDIFERDLPIPILAGETTFCVGDSAILTTDTHYKSYFWDGLDSSATFYVKSSGSHTLTVEDVSGCKGTITFTTESRTGPEPQIFGDSLICMGDFATLSGGNQTNYLWSSGETTKEINVEKNGVYWLKVEDTLGCVGTDTFKVQFFDLPQIMVEPSELLTAFGDLDTLRIIGDVPAFSSVSWQSLFGSLCENCTSIIYEASENDVLMITALDQNGCQQHVEVNITVIEDNEEQLYFSNILRPGSGNTNDGLIYVAKGKDFKLQSVKIFDRWGNLVHFGQNLDGNSGILWNGQMANGGDTLPGVYVMNVTYSFKDQVKTVVKTVTVVR
ncbi:MAG: hypothetical protein WAT92_20245 [Saprospiraceae bacterium]